MKTMPLPPVPPSSEALLRYSVLAQVQALILGGWGPSAAMREVAGREHARPDGHVVRVSVRTIQRWRSAYARDGIGGLEPASRKRTETSVILDDALIAFLRTENERDPRAGVPELIRRARVRGIVPEDLPIDRSTVWRACRRMGLVTRARPSKHEGDMRRWSYPHRMQCVLCDGKHFRAGAGRLRRVALFFLDDATGYGLYVQVGSSESTRLFLRGLYDLVLKYGLSASAFHTRTRPSKPSPRSSTSAGARPSLPPLAVARPSRSASSVPASPRPATASATSRSQGSRARAHRHLWSRWARTYSTPRSSVHTPRMNSASISNTLRPSGTRIRPRSLRSGSNTVQ
jgi:transposase